MQINLAREVAALRRMTTSQLVERYADVFCEETRTRHKAYLIRKIAWRLQANAEGDLSIRARRRAAQLADDSDVRVMPPRNAERPKYDVTPIEHSAPVSSDPRLPAPGTAITRKYKGRTIHVVVLPDGFDYGGERYRSLSAVAKAVTGSHCNGFRFFNLEATTNE